MASAWPEATTDGAKGLDEDQLERAWQLACAVATCASAQLLTAFRSDDLTIATKADGSPVTRADREAEASMRAKLRASSEFGRLAILGEEGGLEGGETPYRWLLDPLDGTMSFIRGIPTFGTIVALEETETGRPLVGVIHLPCLGDTFMAGRGLGSWCNARRVHVSAASDLCTALVSAPDARQFRQANLRAAYGRLWDACERLRGSTDCWAPAQVARGIIDAVVEPGLHPWDIRATQVLIEEAGGKQMTRPSASPGTVDSIFGSATLVDQLAELMGF
jgi:histidinol phosphatase-like enzyme (inositol monophosphatase family)